MDEAGRGRQVGEVSGGFPVHSDVGGRQERAAWNKTLLFAVILK